MTLRLIKSALLALLLSSASYAKSDEPLLARVMHAIDIIFPDLMELKLKSQELSLPLQDKLDELISRLNDKAYIGLYVQSLKDGKVLYRYNDSLGFVPASSLKILTAIGALIYLGPHYRYETKITSTQKIEKGILEGSLTIEFTGDPTLKLADLDKMISTLSQMGLKTIKGNFFIDDMAFALEHDAPGWMIEDRASCFGAPVSASIIDENCMSLEVVPNKKVGLLASIQTDLDYRIAINSIVTKRSSKDCGVQIKLHDDLRYRLKGCVPFKKKKVVVEVAIRKIREYTIFSIKQLLAKYNIKYTGDIVHKALDNKAKTIILASYRSADLSEILEVCLKDSNNLMTEAILKKIGQKYYKKPATWRSSVKALKEILAKSTGIDKHDLQIADGSGLSRYNIVTPEVMGRVLHYAYHNKRIRSYIWESLPVSGHDGTLEDRMNKKPLLGKIRAKTGSMTGVTSLVGFAENTTNDHLLFVILQNNYMGSSYRFKKLEEKICTALVTSRFD